MEYNLLKTIEPTIGGIFCPNEMYPRLSPFPATDYVNPGLGQISRLYSFYVPLHSKETLHMKQKKINILELEGSGSGQKAAEIEQNPEKNENEEIKAQLESDPETFNELKRKLMGPAVHESFLHPKVIKTDKLFFKETNPKKATGSGSFKSLTMKPVKHKFEFE
jgi:hypothetical protein